MSWEQITDPRTEICWTCGYRLEYWGNHDLECPKCGIADHGTDQEMGN